MKGCPGSAMGCAPSGMVFLCLGIEEDASQDGDGADALKGADPLAKKKQAQDGGEDGLT